MTLTWVLAAMAALPPPAKSIAVLDFETAGVTAELAAAADLLVPQEVRRHAPAARVVSGNDIRALLGNERQKQLLGCGDASSCIAELAGAIGSDELVTGKIGRIGTQYVVELRRLDAARGRAIHSLTRTASREEALIDAIRGGIAELYPPPPASGRDYAWIPAAGGAVALGAGTFFLFEARGAHEQLRADDPPVSGEAPAQIRRRGESAQVLGFVGVGLGIAALAGAGALLAFGAPADPATSVQVAFTGQAVTLSVRLP